MKKMEIPQHIILFFHQIPTFIRTSSIFVAVTLIILNEYLSIWTVSFNFGNF